MKKICPKCKIEKEYSEFHKDRQQSSGIKPYCKECQKEMSKQTYYKNVEKRLMAIKTYYAKNKERLIKIQTQRHRDIRNTLEGKMKYDANRAVNLAIRTNKLKRKPCEICGNEKSHGHHYLGYAPENWFKVKWLCLKHHFYYHRNNA